MTFSHLNLSAILAAAPVAPAADAPNPMGTLIPIVLMFVIFYFVLIRPQKKKQDALRKQVDAMKIGDDVVTAGGIHGTVTNKNDAKDIVTVRVADGVKLRFDKASINKVTPSSKSKASDEEEETEEVEMEVEEETRKD